MNVLRLVGYWLGRGTLFIVAFVSIVSFEIVKKVFLGIAVFALGALILYIQLGIGAWIVARVLLWLIHGHQ